MGGGRCRFAGSQSPARRGSLTPRRDPGRRRLESVPDGASPAERLQRSRSSPTTPPPTGAWARRRDASRPTSTARNPGTYTGGVTLGQPGALVGDPNTAVSFDGVNDYVLVPDSSALERDGRRHGREPGSSAASPARGRWSSASPGTASRGTRTTRSGSTRTNQVVAYFGNGVELRLGRAPLDTNWHHVAATLRQRDGEALRRRGAGGPGDFDDPPDRERAAPEHGAHERRLLLLRRPPRRGGGLRHRALGRPHPGPLRGRSRDRQRRRRS